MAIFDFKHLQFPQARYWRPIPNISAVTYPLPVSGVASQHSMLSNFFFARSANRASFLSSLPYQHPLRGTTTRRMPQIKIGRNLHDQIKRTPGNLPEKILAFESLLIGVRPPLTIFTRWPSTVRSRFWRFIEANSTLMMKSPAGLTNASARGTHGGTVSRGGIICAIYCKIPKTPAKHRRSQNRAPRRRARRGMSR